MVSLNAFKNYLNTSTKFNGAIKGRLEEYLAAAEDIWSKKLVKFDNPRELLSESMLNKIYSKYSNLHYILINTHLRKFVYLLDKNSDSDSDSESDSEDDQLAQDYNKLTRRFNAQEKEFIAMKAENKKVKKQNKQLSEENESLKNRNSIRLILSDMFWFVKYILFFIFWSVRMLVYTTVKMLMVWAVKWVVIVLLFGSALKYFGIGYLTDSLQCFKSDEIVDCFNKTYF